MAGLKRRFDYLRLSLEDGDVASGNSNESQSIESQRKCCRQFRAEHPDLMDGFEEIVDEISNNTLVHLFTCTSVDCADNTVAINNS